VEGAQVPPSRPVRADLPGALDHAGDVDEFDAALIRGAGGVTATPDSGLEDEQAEPAQPQGEPQAREPRTSGLRAPVVGDSAAAGPVEPVGAAAAPDGELQEALPRPGADGGAGGGAGGSAAVAFGGAEGEPEHPAAPRLRGFSRAAAFLRASWAELQRVQWPDRRQVTQATAVVLGFVAIAGAYLGLADYVAKEIVEFIL